jgi:hypothetical protein
MHYLEQWKAVSARIRGLAEAATLDARYGKLVGGVYDLIVLES